MGQPSIGSVRRGAGHEANIFVGLGIMHQSEVIKQNQRTRPKTTPMVTRIIHIIFIRLDRANDHTFAPIRSATAELCMDAVAKPHLPGIGIIQASPASAR